METVSHQRISDANPTHIITACEDTDTCPGCGAGYKVGLSACEYCRRPVRLATGGLVSKDMLAIMHTGEAIVPRLIAEDFESSLQRLAGKAQMVHRDDGTTGFTFG
ncbi:hypothetical protein [Acidovorax kalamii]|uniref:hypothetical protein n=1 Tax=Acidovorax kalamii TaxID=2004485 RepID=UPI0020913B3E|nr:hypothetical protein [Acidovorax kalamii]MCO5355076.1 hypothetical protein [Acidovorax kalamii]